MCVLSNPPMAPGLIEDFNLFLKNDVISEGAVSHNVLYYQQVCLHCICFNVIRSFYVNVLSQWIQSLRHGQTR